MNLLAETISAIQSAGVHTSTVQWVGSDDCWCTWEEFVANADIEYTRGGSQTTPVDLKVVGDNWWMDRFGDDVGDYWVFQTLALKPGRHLRENIVFVGNGNSTFQELNSG